LGEIEAKKIFLQGIIDFRRAILADTPQGPFHLMYTPPYGRGQ
jgi:hypothetical protein